ncbi:hypothetical protein [Lactobacillus sp. ESL0230]|uniref:hypothetical protein n=1 Tax=Lactobacillus sp. ESL0230 TaxID=2069353 RepID=UPI000EFB903D|nr:hypothetical protein [Lactobacillus sp. ESL0230]RMC46727.1 hypothetical protein F5ESL0230_05605 [Lactobacillus sp. ESL0230]
MQILLQRCQQSINTIINKEVFNNLEAKGYNVKSILSEKEYQAALIQDMLRRGGTYIKTNKHGFTLYINSALTKLIIASGSVAVTVGLGLLLASAGLDKQAIDNAKIVISPYCLKIIDYFYI